MSIKNNTASLRELLEAVNNLPDAGGVELPTLTNEGSAADLMLGKELIDADGSKVTGTFTIDSELSAQDGLIAQIQSALEGKASGGGSGGSGNVVAINVSIGENRTAVIYYFSNTGFESLFVSDESIIINANGGILFCYHEPNSGNYTHIGSITDGSERYNLGYMVYFSSDINNPYIVLDGEESESEIPIG